MDKDFPDICHPHFVKSDVKQNPCCFTRLGPGLALCSIYPPTHCQFSVIIIIIINDGNN